MHGDLAPANKGGSVGLLDGPPCMHCFEVVGINTRMGSVFAQI